MQMGAVGFSSGPLWPSLQRDSSSDSLDKALSLPRLMLQMWALAIGVHWCHYSAFFLSVHLHEYLNTVYTWCLIAKYCFTRGLGKYFEQVCSTILSNLVWVQLLSLNTSLLSPLFIEQTLLQLIFNESWTGASRWRRQWGIISRAALKELLV